MELTNLIKKKIKKDAMEATSKQIILKKKLKLQKVKRNAKNSKRLAN